MRPCRAVLDLWSQAAGVRLGSTITEINGTAVSSKAEIVKVMTRPVRK